jgi:hypothetical protein
MGLDADPWPQRRMAMITAWPELMRRLAMPDADAQQMHALKAMT